MVTVSSRSKILFALSIICFFVVSLPVKEGHVERSDFEPTTKEKTWYDTLVVVADDDRRTLTTVYVDDHTAGQSPYSQKFARQYNIPGTVRRRDSLASYKKNLSCLFCNCTHTSLPDRPNCKVLLPPHRAPV